ncbi:MAG: acyl-CoA dehydrogenase [Pseudonocardiales bacterium]|nr:acyl-CoA dehydrogenase [Pseudonocardiales bacterium]
MSSTSTVLDNEQGEQPDRSAIRELAQSVARERYRPLAAQWDLGRTHLPVEERRYLGSLGLLGIGLPAEYGGSGGNLMDALTVLEELGKECLPAAFAVFEACTGPAQVVNLLGSEDQRARFLPGITSGETGMALAISEPDAGSAATDLTTRARRTGDGYVVNGAKRWTSGGGAAETYLVYARIGDQLGAKGIGALLVEADRPGVSFGSPERLMGFRGVPSADVLFDDVHVPAENLLVDVGGFSSLFRAFSIERLGNATMSLAIAQAALDRTIAYVQERAQFGKTLIEFQTVQLTVAEMHMQIQAARQLILRAATNLRGGYPNSLEVSVAKCTSNEMAKRVTDLAMQMHGGNGYTEEFGLERLHRDAHGWAIAGGTPTMQRIRIASELLGRSFSQRG